MATIGRPTDYKPEYNEQATRFALLGYTAQEIAAVFGVSKSTFQKWKKDFPDFSAAVTRGRDVADAEVAAAFYKRATGFVKTEQKAFVVSVGDFTQDVKIVNVEVHYPPDAGAALNWLKNRQPGKWRDKQEIKAELSGNLEITFDLSNLSDNKSTDEVPDSDSPE